MRLFYSTILIIHGLIHLLGFAKAFGLAELPQLTVPIGRPMGLVWALAAGLVLGGAAAPWLWPRGGWVVALAAALVSQGVILSSWSDARVGTLPNILLLAVAILGAVTYGPFSLYARYRADVAALPTAAPGPVLETELVTLPAPVARYLRHVGVVGRPHVNDVFVRMTGRIRGAPGDAWMPFVAEQHNTANARLFWMEATRGGVPVSVYHRFVGGAATMTVRLLGVVPMVENGGEAFSRAETVTLFNDICLLAPDWLLDPKVVWGAASEHIVDATFTHAGRSIAAALTFNARDELVDFVSDDRAIAAADGTLTPSRWSTPIEAYSQFGAFTLIQRGAARWTVGDFAYIEMTLDAVEYNVVR